MPNAHAQQADIQANFRDDIGHLQKAAAGIVNVEKVSWLARGV